MSNTRCPSCGFEARVPSSILGKKVRCKGIGCQQVFVAVEYIPPSSKEEVEEVVVASPNVFDSLKSSNYTLPSDDDGSIRKRQKRISKSKDLGNYPNLQKYLTWARLAATTQLVLMLLLACFVFLVDFLAVMKRDSSFQDSLIPLASGFFASAIIAVVAYSTYVFLMAVVEFIHVIVDIESNTRRMASREAENLHADSL